MFANSNGCRPLCANCQESGNSACKGCLLVTVSIQRYAKAPILAMHKLMYYTKVIMVRPAKLSIGKLISMIASRHLTSKTGTLRGWPRMWSPWLLTPKKQNNKGSIGSTSGSTRRPSTSFNSSVTKEATTTLKIVFAGTFSKLRMLTSKEQTLIIARVTFLTPLLRCP